MKNGNPSIPAIIILIGILAAIIILFGDERKEKAPAPEEQKEETTQVTEEPKAVGIENLKPVDENDHIIGSLDQAKVVIIEYSDFECGFCAKVHPTIKQLVKEYEGQVAWVYRHFPIYANRLAQASECVAGLGGNDAFWNFVDGVFDGRIDKTTLLGTANVAGVSEADVQTCLTEARYAEDVKSDFENAKATGGKGTPYSIIVGSNGVVAPISGAQPIEVWRQVIDQILSYSNS